MKKSLLTLLRGLQAGLVFCGYQGANLYSSYIDDWYYSISGERLHAHPRP